MRSLLRDLRGALLDAQEQGGLPGKSSLPSHAMVKTGNSHAVGSMRPGG